MKDIWFKMCAVIIGLGLGWTVYQFYLLGDSQAWIACLGATDQSSAQNLVCRSQYPHAYTEFSNEFSK